MRCLEFEVRSTGARSDTVAESPESPASRNAARSSSMGDVACVDAVCVACDVVSQSGARVAKPSPSSDVVGFFVGFGGVREFGRSL